MFPKAASPKDLRVPVRPIAGKLIVLSISLTALTES
jgi:hypothetical protein